MLAAARADNEEELLKIFDNEEHDINHKDGCVRSPGPLAAHRSLRKSRMGNTGTCRSSALGCSADFGFLSTPLRVSIHFVPRRDIYAQPLTARIGQRVVRIYRRARTHPLP